MSLGESTWSVTPGGGRQRISGAKLARAVVQLGCCTIAPANNVVKIGDPSGLTTLLGAGQLPEALAIRLRQGQTAYAMPLEPSVAGAVGAVTQVGDGAGTITPYAAPHKLIEGKISTGGTLGTMAIRTRVGGVGNYSAPVVSESGPWEYRVPGSYVHLTFSAGTYTVDHVFAVGTDGTITSTAGSATAGSATSSAGPFHIHYNDHWDVSVDQGTTQVFTFRGTRGSKVGAAATYAGVSGTVVVRIDEQAAAHDITCTFDGSENTQAKALQAFNNALMGAHAVASTTEVLLESDRYGTSSNIRIVSGTAGLLTALGLATGLGTAGTATVDKDGGGYVSKSIAFLDAATAAELDVALVPTGATLVASTVYLVLTSSVTGASPKGVQVKSASTNVLGFATTEFNGTSVGILGSLSMTADPIDNYDVKITVTKAGDAGVAKIKISLDDGITSLPPMLTAGSGFTIIPNAGLSLLCSGPYVLGNTYSFPTVGPSPSSGDLDDAMTALRLDRTFQSSLIHIIGTPPTAADAMTQAETLDAALVDAFNTDGLDWQGMTECPVVDDLVIDTDVAIPDVDDDDDTIATARESLDLTRTALCAGTHRMISRLAGSGSAQLRRPLGWALVHRYVDTDPRNSLAAVADGKLAITVVGRDEAMTPGLDDVQIDTVRTYREEPGAAYLSITSGGFGWKNLTTSADFGDAEAVRLLDVFIAALRARARRFLGQRPPTNPDGTILEKTAAGWDTPLDDTAKKAVGLKVGGDFVEPQASSASAHVLRSSQLGNTPRRLDIGYTLQPLGYVSDVANQVFFSGTLTVSE